MAVRSSHHVCSNRSFKSSLTVRRLEGSHIQESLFRILQTVNVALFQLNIVGVYVSLQAATINGRSCYGHDGFNTTTRGVQTLKSYNVHSNIKPGRKPSLMVIFFFYDDSLIQQKTTPSATLAGVC